MSGRPGLSLPLPGSAAAGPSPADRLHFSDRRVERDLSDPGTRSEPMPIRTIGIIGGGTMGSGIAQISATAGLTVILVDVSEAAGGQGLAAVTPELQRAVSQEEKGLGRQHG